MQDTYESFDEAIKNSINYVSFENDTAVTFRIDNDDAVQKDFIEKLSFFLKDEFVGNTISMPSNYIVKRIGEKHYKVEERYYPANSIGLANVTTKQDFKSIMEFGQHHLMNDENTMILLARKTNGGLMTINGDNAINTIDDSKSVILDEKSVREYLKKHKIENLNLESLRVFKLERKNYFIKIWKIIILFVPPIFRKIYHKIVNIFGKR